MSNTKSRLRELERVNQRMEVVLTSLTFDNEGKSPSELTRAAFLQCEGSAYEIVRHPGEAPGGCARRAEAEVMAMARTARPKAIILAPGAEDL